MLPFQFGLTMHSFVLSKCHVMSTVSSCVLSLSHLLSSMWWNSIPWFPLFGLINFHDFSSVFSIFQYFLKNIFIQSMISYFHSFYFSNCQISLTFPVFIPFFQCQNFFIFPVFWVKFPDFSSLIKIPLLP